MKTIQYETGRDYGAPQVLEITFAPIDPYDFDAGTELFPVEFVDAVRGISGAVKVFGSDANENRIGRAVLAEYDAGRYTPV